jgi:hypothetical protein
MRTLVPYHGHFDGRKLHGRLEELYSRDCVREEPGGQHRNQVGIAHQRDDEQQVR